MGPINSKITLTKEKERRKRKRARRKKGGEEKKAMVALLVFIMATLETGGEKNVGRKKIHLAVTFSKIRLDIK